MNHNNSNSTKCWLGHYLASAGWALTVLAVLLAVVVWAESFDWQFNYLNLYLLFPVFGLIAFSVMWSQYMVTGLRRLLGLPTTEALKTYFSATGWLALVVILTHPSLLAWQLWKAGAGLPPASELNYVGDGLRGAAIVGMSAWVIFLAYELRRKYSKQSWWRFADYAVDLAMVGIVYHSFRLGGALQTGWFRGVWWFYAASLIIVLGHKYFQKVVNAKTK